MKCDIRGANSSLGLGVLRDLLLGPAMQRALARDTKTIATGTAEATQARAETVESRLLLGLLCLLSLLQREGRQADRAAVLATLGLLVAVRAHRHTVGDVHTLVTTMTEVRRRDL